MSNTLDDLTRTGEHDDVDLGDISTESLTKLAEQPASELSVLLGIRRHSGRCSAKSILRRYTLAISFAAGMVVVGQAAAVWLVHSTLTAARAELKETIRQMVDAILKEKKIIGDAGPVHGAGSTLVATEVRR